MIAGRAVALGIAVGLLCAACALPAWSSPRATATAAQLPAVAAAAHVPVRWGCRGPVRPPEPPG